MNSQNEMKAVLLRRYDRGLVSAIDALEVTTRPMPRPSRGQVLVRMAAAPCNQADFAKPLRTRIGADPLITRRVSFRLRTPAPRE
jgi:hypothetical protein